MTGIVAAYESSAVQDLKISNPENYNEYQALVKKGDALMAQGKFPQAFDSFKEANALAPKDFITLAAMGKTHRAAGSYNDAMYYFTQAETQASLDNKYGDVENADYYDLMSKLSDERVRTAKDRLSLCKGDVQCIARNQQAVDQYERELSDWNVKKAQAESGIGVPEPLCGVIIGLCCAVILIARRKV